VAVVFFFWSRHSRMSTFYSPLPSVAGATHLRNSVNWPSPLRSRPECPVLNVSPPVPLSFFPGMFFSGSTRFDRFHFSLTDISVPAHYLMPKPPMLALPEARGSRVRSRNFAFPPVRSLGHLPCSPAARQRSPPSFVPVRVLFRVFPFSTPLQSTP